MAPILFQFLTCSHLENDPKVHKLWRKLQERSALPESLTVKSALPCRHCSQSQVTYYTDISEWLYGTYKTDNKDSTGMLAELIWVRSALEQQHLGLPEAKAMCALLALAACRLRERHVDELEVELRSHFAQGRNGSSSSSSSPPSLSECELNIFYLTQAERFGNVARRVSLVAATQAYLCPSNPPHLAPKMFAYFQRRITGYRTTLETHADDLVSRATQLVDSLLVRSDVNEDDDGGVAATNKTTTVASHEAEQVKLIKDMNHIVDSIVGVVTALREVVVRAEASPRYLPEYDSWKQELPSRKIFGLF